VIWIKEECKHLYSSRFTI